MRPRPSSSSSWSASTTGLTRGGERGLLALSGRARARALARVRYTFARTPTPRVRGRSKGHQVEWAFPTPGAAAPDFRHLAMLCLPEGAHNVNGLGHVFFSIELALTPNEPRQVPQSARPRLLRARRANAAPAGRAHTSTQAQTQIRMAGAGHAERSFHFISSSLPGLLRRVVFRAAQDVRGRRAAQDVRRRQV